MKEVNIYLYSTIKSPRPCNGAYTYILEVNTVNGPATLSKTETVKSMTANRSVLCAMAAALKRIHHGSRLIIYTDSFYLATNTMESLALWKRNHWNSAKGEPVKNLSEWKDIYSFIREHSFKFVVGTEHSYYQWLKSESEKAAGCISQEN